MARNNLQRYPESIKGNQCGSHNCWSCNDRAGDDNRMVGGATNRQRRRERATVTNRLRIGNIAAIYLFIGLVFLQSGYLCHGTYLLTTSNCNLA